MLFRSGVVLGPFAVDEVGTLGLGQTVDLGAGEASKKLFGEAVAYCLAFLSLAVLEHLFVSV